eukprot:1546338-Prymnesium_polylepis.1
MSPHVTGTAPALHPSAQHAPPPRRAHHHGSVHPWLSTLPSRHATCPTPCHVHHAVAPPVRASLCACPHTCRPDARVPPRRHPREHPGSLRRASGAQCATDYNSMGVGG